MAYFCLTTLLFYFSFPLWILHRHEITVDTVLFLTDLVKAYINFAHHLHISNFTVPYLMNYFKLVHLLKFKRENLVRTIDVALHIDIHSRSLISMITKIISGDLGH